MKEILKLYVFMAVGNLRKVNLSSYPFIRVQLLDMKAVNNGTFV